MVLKILKQNVYIQLENLLAVRELFLYVLCSTNAAIIPQRNIVSHPIQHLFRKIFLKCGNKESS